MKDFNYEKYRKNNPLLKESLSSVLSQYVESAAERCFGGGGNGENLMQYGLPEVAEMIDSNMMNGSMGNPDEDGFYTQATAIAFKKFVDSMVKDEIENNNASRYGGGDDEDTYDEFTDTIKNIK